MNIQDYWCKVREIERDLPIKDGVVWIATLSTPTGVSPSTAENAARFIVENRARLATPEELAKHKTEEERRKQVHRAIVGANRFTITDKPMDDLTERILTAIESNKTSTNPTGRFLPGDVRGV